MASDLFLILRPNSGSPTFVTETLDAQFKAYTSLELTNFQLAGANPTSIQGAGKVTFDLFTFTKQASINSPRFLQYCAGGIALNRATLYVRQSGTTNILEVYTFGTAYVMSYAHDLNNGTNDTETITINYAQFDHRYYPYSATGVRGTPVEYGWSVAASAPWAASPLDGPTP